MFQPFGNTTVLPPAAWHSEPRSRGTMSILSSCLITMSLCIWTSLHLNLPSHKKQHLQKYRKLGWMVLGLLAPELVVWNAYEQKKTVKKLNALMKEKAFMPEKPKMWLHVRRWVVKAWRKAQVFSLLRAEDWPELANSDQPRRFGLRGERRHAWSNVHSWLVVMGGMAFEDTAPEEKQFMPDGCQRTTLSLPLFEWVVKNRPLLVPDVSREYIEDKSKSDRLAKVLTCWQTGYFCIQCTFRLSQRFSVTLLELNVFAHSICALLLFLIWWDKPRDVQEPCLILGEEALDICACSVNNLWRLLRHWPLDPQPSEGCLEISRPTTLRFEPRPHSQWVAIMGSNTYRYLKVCGTCWPVSGLQAFWFNGEKQITLDNRKIELLVRINIMLKKDSTLVRSINTAYPYRTTFERMPDWDMPTLEAIKDKMLSPDYSSLFDSSFCWVIAGTTLAGACYGGVHLAAWASQFRSFTEAMLWRAASVTVFATGPMLVLTIICASSLVSMYRWLEINLGLRAFPRYVVGLLILLLILLVVLWYLVCRTFIVVECFIMLAHIPESALHVPTWSAYIPHIA